MLTSLALIFLVGILLGSLFQKLYLPSLIGMLFTGIFLGPYVFDLMDDSIISMSSDLRKIALVIILTRVGLALNVEDLKKVGRPAVLMCFIPACFEITGYIVLAPLFFDVTRMEAALMGTIMAAVSPAVVVPRMLKLMEEGYGKNHSIPQLIMAGSSVDDIFDIVLFTSCIQILTGGTVSAGSFVQIPISIVLGIAAGIVIGLCLTWFFKNVHIRDSIKVILILCIAFLLVGLEDVLKGILPFSGLLAIMSLSAAILSQYVALAKRLSAKFSKLWVAAEVLLFVLVGATVDPSYAVEAGAAAVILVLIALLFRMAGVFFCLIKTKLTKKERLFATIAYLPKATVQAAIGSIPFTLNLACGQVVLTVAVIAILVTAPFGAFLIDKLYPKLLEKA